MSTLPLGLSVPRALTLLIVWLWVSIFIPIEKRRKLFLRWLSEAWGSISIAECH